MKKNFIKLIIISLSFIAITVVILTNVIYYSNMSHWEIPQIQYYGLKRNMISLFVMATIVTVCYFINKIKLKKNVKRGLLILILFLYCGVQVCWIISTPAKQFADSLEVLQISEQMTKNIDLNEYQINYLQYYPQQLTMVIFFKSIFSVLKNCNYIIPEILNVLSNLFTVIGLYLILLEFEKKHRVNRTLFFVMILTFLPIIFLSSFVYGDFIGLACSIWSVYFYIKFINEKKYRFISYIGILMFFACMVRMNYFIIVIAIVISFLQIRLEQESTSIIEWGKFICVVFAIVMIVFVPSSLLKRIYAKKYNIQLDKSFSTIPYVYMGMSEGERANGWYNDEIGEIVFELMNSKSDTGIIMEACKKKTIDRLKFLFSHPAYAIKFYRDKMITIWADPTMEYKFYNTYEIESEDTNLNPICKNVLFGSTYEYVVIYQKALILLIFVGALSTIILERKKMNFSTLLLYLIFLGGFSFHIFWEAKSRYIIPYIVLLIPNSCIGVTELIELLKEKLRNERQV